MCATIRPWADPAGLIWDVLSQPVETPVIRRWKVNGQCRQKRRSPRQRNFPYAHSDNRVVGTQTTTGGRRVRDTTAAGLAARLREATAAQHRDTETRSFVTQLMRGALDLRAYVRYLAQYAYVYRALESRNARLDDPEFVNHPALVRFPSIVSDLSNLGADDWETSHPPLPATIDYTQRIESVSSNFPRYVAHHYTRYLGDLSGGQLIAKRLAEHYGATHDQLSFYRFEANGRPERFKVEYRRGLDSLSLDDQDEAALIGEAKLAFQLNADLFDVLGSS